MYDKEDVLKYEGKYIKCIQTSETHTVTEGKFYKIIDFHDFGENRLLIHIRADWNYEKIYGTIPFYLDNLHVYFQLKSREECRIEKIKQILNE